MAASLADLRRAFPALGSDLCFLDWGSTGLLPDCTRVALAELGEKLAICPDGRSTWVHGVHGGTRNEARGLLAELVGAQPKDIALVESTTAGLNAAVSSIRLRPGENVVLSGIDYLAVATPWKHRQRRDEIELRYVAPCDGSIRAEDVLDQIDAKTRVIALSTICWTTGALIDLEAVGREARQRGILLLLDGVQTFGVVPLDVKSVPAAFVAVGGHKWMCSPLGAGFLYVNPLIAARHQPPLVGFLAGQPQRGPWWEWFQRPESSPQEQVLFPATGRTFETGGTPSYPGAIGLLQTARLLQDVGIPTICEHVRDLGERLIAGLDDLGLEVLTPRDRERRGGLVVFKIAGGVEAERAVVDKLRATRVVVSVRYAAGHGGVRVSLHGMNDLSDVERFLEGVARSLP